MIHRIRSPYTSISQNFSVSPNYVYSVFPWDSRRIILSASNSYFVFNGTNMTLLSNSIPNVGSPKLLPANDSVYIQTGLEMS